MNKIFYGCCLVIGIINIALAILNIKSIIFSLKSINDFLGFILPFQGTEVSLSAIYQMFPKLEPFIKTFLSPFIGYTISIILLISGIGIILRKSWGRSLSRFYAISMIVISLIGFPIAFVTFINEFITIEKYGFFRGLVWGGQ